jgi:hypothetical protein
MTTTIRWSGRAAAVAVVAVVAVLPAGCGDEQVATAPAALHPSAAPGGATTAQEESRSAVPTAPATPEYDEAGLVERAKAR